MSNKEDLLFGCNSKSLDQDQVSINKIVADLLPHLNSINNIEFVEDLYEAVSFVKAHNGNKLQLTMSNKEDLTSLDENRVSFKVAVDELVSHFRSINDNVAVTILQEAVSFAKARNGSWKFWTCCHCDEKFDDRDLHYDHVMSMHLGTLSLEQRLVLPSRVSSDWYSMISNASWRPIDTSAALKILQEQYELLLSKHNEAFKVTVDESELQSLEEPLKTKEDDLKMRARKYYLAQTWPLSDDLDREKKLGIVSKFLNYLLVQNYLTESHLDKVISYTMKELKDSVSSVDVELLCLDQTHVCICFLQASQLEKVAGFLKDLFQSSTNFSDKYNIKDTVIPSTMGVENKEKLVLNGDSFFIFVDSLISENSSNDDSENIGTCNSDPLFSWIFTGPSSEEELESLRQLENDRKIQGKELIRTCEKYFVTLKHLVEEKCNQLSYKEALGLIWDCCLKELLRRSRDTHHVPRRFEEIFKGIEQNPFSIRKFDNYYPFSHIDLYNDMKIRSQDSHVMKAISNVLKEQQSINVMPKKGLIGFTPGISFHENLPEDRLTAVWIDADSCLEAAVKREGANNDIELQETDAQIMQTLASLRRMVFGINSFAAGDFQAALLPLVKSYIRHTWRDLRKKMPEQNL